jgi:hypothetical protein
MAKIKVRGFNDLVDVTQQEATQIKSFVDNPNVPRDARITLPGGSFIKGDIGTIFFDETAPTDNSVESQERRYREERRRFLGYSPELKARKAIPWFEVLYKAARGEKPPEETIRRATQVMQEFYSANPGRIFADLSLLKPIIGELRKQSDSQMHTAVRSRVLNLLINCEATDREYAKQGF